MEETCHPAGLRGAWIHQAIVTLLGPHGASESENYQTEILFHFLPWQRASRSLLFSELHLNREEQGHPLVSIISAGVHRAVPGTTTTQGQPHIRMAMLLP